MKVSFEEKVKNSKEDSNTDESLQVTAMPLSRAMVRIFKKTVTPLQFNTVLSFIYYMTWGISLLMAFPFANFINASKCIA